MIVAVVRHAKVDMKKTRPARLPKMRASFFEHLFQTSEQYNEELAMYDAAPVLPVTVNLPEADFKRIYVSRLPRTAATARQVVGNRKLTATALINEVPEVSGFDTLMRLPHFLHAGVGRIQWLLCARRQPETRTETQLRAERFVKLLIRRNEDCVVFTHGFFMTTLLREMKKQGFRPDHVRLHYANGECVVCKMGISSLS